MALQNRHLIALGLISQILCFQAKAAVVIDLQYGQSAKLWSEIHSVKIAKGNLAAINSFLDENYGKFEAAFAHLDTSFRFIDTGSDGPFAHIAIGLDIESALVGMIRNPVLPELNAAGIAMAKLRVDGIGTIGAMQSRLGLCLGDGIEKQVSAVSTDLLDKIPVNSSNVKLVGLDIELRKQYFISNELQLKLRALDQESYYSGIQANAPTLSDEKLPSFTHHWQLRSDLALENSSLHAILGPHPLPLNLLPRVWDRAANTYAWPELGAMFGLGLSQTFPISAATKLSATAGLYAGYFGAGLDFAFHSLYMQLGSWKIENSAAYRTLGQRVYNASLIFTF